MERNISANINQQKFGIAMLISNKANISTKKTNKENGANSLMIQE
jgi:hypothetical protein